MALEPVRVSPNHRFLVTETGRPFFWLGDTAWQLFHHLTRDEASLYLDTRRQQGFNVIQAVILSEQGMRSPNANGRVALCGDDPTRPNEYYFRDVDEIIRLAGANNLYVGLLPTWGDKVHSGLWGVGPAIFNVENARVYGKFLGHRYRDDTNIIWILGGDRPAKGYEAVWNAMSEGIVEGLGRRPLFTYHPCGLSSSSESLHDAPWLDLNMIQSGHGRVDSPTWDMITADYNRTPAKPVLDGEPNYENHAMDPFSRTWKKHHGRFRDYDVRKQAYRAVFAGAAGHTYGSHSVWQFWAEEHPPVSVPLEHWDEAIYEPGAYQMIHLKNLMLSRPYLSRIPAQDMLPDEPPTPPLGDPDTDRHNPRRAAHPRATRCSEGTYAMIYFPLASQSLRVDLRNLRGPVDAWWYDPRTGQAHPAGRHQNDIATFTSPIAGPDWVLVMDCVESGFAAPGTPQASD